MPQVLITGASRGLGRALALGFSAKGWPVSVCATADHDAIQSLAKELAAEHLALPCDVTQPLKSGPSPPTCWSASARPTCCSTTRRSSTATPSFGRYCLSEVFSRVIDVNLQGVHGVIRALLPAMLAEAAGWCEFLLRVSTTASNVSLSPSSC